MDDAKKEPMVSFYDPVVDAYRDIPLSLAKKYLEAIEEVKKQDEKSEEGKLKEQKNESDY